MSNTPNTMLMDIFSTEDVYRTKLAGAPSLVNQLCTDFLSGAPDEKVATVLPWGGKLQTMNDSAKIAWQAGELMAKQSGIIGGVLGGVKDVGVAAAKLPFEAAGVGAKSFWKNTSAATKAKAGLIGGGLALGGAGLATGMGGSKLIGAADRAASGPPMEHVAHVLSQEELEKAALSFSGLGAMWQGLKSRSSLTPLVQGAKSGLSSGLSTFKGPRIQGGTFGEHLGRTFGHAKQDAASAYRSSAANVAQNREIEKGIRAWEKGKVVPPKPPAPTPSPQPAQGPYRTPAQVQPPPPPPVKNAPASPQQATQPTGQPPAATQPTGTSAQKGQQASTQAGNQGAAATQTPQEAGKSIGSKMRGALPWVAGGVGLGVAGLGAGAAMMGKRGIEAMGGEGHIPNTYTGYGAPIAGSASPYGYVTGPGMG